MNNQIEAIWRESQKYIAFAKEHLNAGFSSAGERTADFDEDEWFRIAFLFPTLPERSKVDLLNVRRHFLLVREHQKREQLDPDDSAEYTEAQAEQAAVQLLEALPSFSDVQRELLKQHYLPREEQSQS